MKKIIATTIAGAAALFLLTGCTGDAQDTQYIKTATPTPSVTSTPSPTPTPEPQPSESPTPTPAEVDNI
jgi:hypothetical protein